MKILAYILNLIGLASYISATLLKGKRIKWILVLVMLGNLMTSLGYLCGGTGISGALSGFLATVQTAINYLFDAKDKPIPKWLIVIYLASFVVLNIWVGGVHYLSFLVIGACFTAVMGVVQKTGAKFRVWTTLNCCIWTAYDLCTHSYGALITHVSLLISTVLGTIINDRKIKKEES